LGELPKLDFAGEDRYDGSGVAYSRMIDLDFSSSLSQIEQLASSKPNHLSEDILTLEEVERGLVD
jgi:hypothetical protein